VIFGAFLINFAALIFLGIVSRRMGAFPAAWTSLPLAMGVLTFPLLAVGGDDETEILDDWLEARLAGYTESSGWEETESRNSAVNWRWIARAERTGG
jgi:hypothetical protein